MTVVTKGVFTKIDNMLMELLTEITDNIYCALAAQAKHLHVFYTPFMATLCR